MNDTSVTELELLRIGATILALIHSGIIEYSCSSCKETDGLADSMNCQMNDIDSPVYFHKDVGELYTCPLKYLTEDIYLYYDEYLYYKILNGGVPLYKDADRMFWEFVKTYDIAKNKYEVEKMNMKSDTNKDKTTDNNLAALRNKFLNKDK